ncbi:MAG: XamI family restriction endonuclease [Kiritimatiellae bacterium]|nr:XamI family restriction endonuclease [Kiritimatiellia bacterium]
MRNTKAHKSATDESPVAVKEDIKVDKAIELALVASEAFETEIFFKMARQLYQDCSTQCEDLFDIAMEKTDGFAHITPKVILEDSRVIKVLRYCMLPVISQMKLGQLVDLPSTKDFEDARIEKGALFMKLERVASKMCNLFVKYLDVQRFLWHQTNVTRKQYALAVEYAKRWTCSLIANQNSSTAFRNWRKELQETAAVNQIVKAGYVSVPTRRIITRTDDILPGQFSRECRVKGRNVQKADIAVRLKRTHKLLLIEAKAIGVRIDAFKRIKECREKFNDWKQTFGNQIEVGVVLSGFIPAREYQSLVDEGAHVFWEHRKADLYDFVKK